MTSDERGSSYFQSRQQSLLALRDLSIVVQQADGSVQTIIDEVNLNLEYGKIVGLVGQSGSGKTQVCYAFLNMVAPPLRIGDGNILFKGQDLLELPETHLRVIRGKQIALISADAKTRLHPTLPVGVQVANVHRDHFGSGRREAKDRAVQQFAKVGLPDPHILYHSYAHELSGGMAQRVMIAMALVSNPEVIIADNPTFGLDVTIQLQILELVQELVEQEDVTMLIATHEVGVVAQYCDEVAILDAGTVVEAGAPQQVLKRPKSAYAKDLIATSNYQQLR